MDNTKCKYCGNTDQFYIKTRVSGVVHSALRFDGKTAHNGGLYDSIDHKDGKYCYCEECEKFIFRIEDMPKQHHLTRG